MHLCVPVADPAVLRGLAMRSVSFSVGFLTRPDRYFSSCRVVSQALII
jgi:hypothetical protein